MTMPIIRIHNSETNEIIDREMTNAEFTQYKADQEARDAAKAEADAKTVAKVALLERIGITADEAALLLG